MVAQLEPHSHEDARRQELLDPEVTQAKPAPSHSFSTLPSGVEQRSPQPVVHAAPHHLERIQEQAGIAASLPRRGEAAVALQLGASHTARPPGHSSYGGSIDGSHSRSSSRYDRGILNPTLNPVSPKPKLSCESGSSSPVASSSAAQAVLIKQYHSFFQQQWQQPACQQWLQEQQALSHQPQVGQQLALQPPLLSQPQPVPGPDLRAGEGSLGHQTRPLVLPNTAIAAPQPAIQHPMSESQSTSLPLPAATSSMPVSSDLHVRTTEPSPVVAYRSSSPEPTIASDVMQLAARIEVLTAQLTIQGALTVKLSGQNTELQAQIACQTE